MLTVSLFLGSLALSFSLLYFFSFLIVWCPLLSWLMALVPCAGHTHTIFSLVNGNLVNRQLGDNWTGTEQNWFQLMQQGTKELLLAAILPLPLITPLWRLTFDHDATWSWVCAVFCCWWECLGIVLFSLNTIKILKINLSICAYFLKIQLR